MSNAKLLNDVENILVPIHSKHSDDENDDFLLFVEFNFLSYDESDDFKRFSGNCIPNCRWDRVATTYITRDIDCQSFRTFLRLSTARYDDFFRMMNVGSYLYIMFLACSLRGEGRGKGDSRIWGQIQLHWCWSKQLLISTNLNTISLAHVSAVQLCFVMSDVKRGQKAETEATLIDHKIWVDSYIVMIIKSFRRPSWTPSWKKTLFRGSYFGKRLVCYKVH